jgi:hypothetical protein
MVKYCFLKYSYNAQIEGIIINLLTHHRAFNSALAQNFLPEVIRRRHVEVIQRA